MSERYANGYRAWGICDRCGLQGRLVTLVFDGQYPNLRVHPECRDIKHPQENLRPVSDAQALWKPRPEEYPYTAPVLSATLGSVHLSWTPASSPVFLFNGYKVYRAIGAADFQVIATLRITRDTFGAGTSETLAYEDETVFDPGAEVRYCVAGYTGTDRTEPSPGYLEATSNIVTLTMPSITAPVLSAQQVECT